MMSKPPADRRVFASARDQMDYLYHKLLYWLYERADRPRARSFATRLARRLAKTADAPGAIFSEECRSLIAEAQGDLPKAIQHRESEVRLIRRLHKLSRHTPQQDIVFRIYGCEDLSDRLDLLAVLYHDAGQLDQAIATLEESKRLCAQQGLKFDGEDLLAEYSTARRKGQKSWNGSAKRRAVS